jgi:hypothetical protein
MHNKDRVADILRKLAKTIREMGDEEWAALSRGGFRINLVPAERARPMVTKRSTFDIEGIAGSLRALDSTAAGMLLLERECPKREHLIQLARHLDLPAEKRDKVERLRERIVDATIGYRLRSMAIHGAKP